MESQASTARPARRRALTSVNGGEIKQAALSAILVDDHTMAKLLGVSTHWQAERMRAQPVIPFCRLGGHVRYSPARVQAAVAPLEELSPPRNSMR